MKKVIIFMNLLLALILAGCGGGDDTVTPTGPVLSAWTRLAGVASANTIGFAVTVDGEGYSYTTGYTTGILDTNRTGNVQEDVFVARYDKDGTRQWIRQMGVEGSMTEGCGIAVDADGNSYIAGWTEANLVAGSGGATGEIDLFVTKYDNAGTRVWVKQLGWATDYCVFGLAIAVDSSGNSYVTGYTDADLDEDGTGVLTGTYDLYVVKYDTNGNRQWIQQRGAAGAENIGSSIAVDQDGNCYVTGKARGDIDTTGPGLTGTTDVFIAKYNTSGTLQWVIQKGVSTKETYGYGIAVDATGNSYVAGTTYGDLDGAGPGTLVGNPDVFVMKYNTSGVLQWLKQTSGAGNWADGRGIALDAAGNCYATGTTNADLDGAGPGVFTGDVNIFVIAYDTDGVSLWSRQMASDVDSDDMNAYGITATTNGTCIVAGYVDEDFDGQTFIGVYADAFVTTKLNE